MKQPLFAFFGTPMLSVHVLDALERQGMLPALIITAPDRPQGRGLTLTPSPVKQWAIERNIDVLTPETLKDENFLAELENTEWDLFVVAMYAKLIPKRVLDMPKKGCLNVHPSLLPKFRGPSPVLSAILADERATGVTIMELREKMDAGPIVAQARIELEEEQPGSTNPGEGVWPPKGSEFEQLLATEGGNLLAETIPHWLAGQIEAEPQDESLATYTGKFNDADSLIDVNGNPREQLLKIRAFDKSPRAHFIMPEGKRVIITDAQIQDGKLKILRVIPEGKKEMPYSDFLRR
ncbi:MAG TPA: methionyl-tRNA formyltransferase [Candidatus Paceibacterota bacterium]|nr:methionyl-tRNA formyltransferase [Candidatus Paceibacterota bacterium]